MVESGSGFQITGLNKGALRYNIDDGLTYQYIGGSANDITSWRVVFGSEAYGQFSNVATVVPGDTNPLIVPLRKDELRGLVLVQTTNIAIQQRGIYTIVFGAQCDKTGGGGGTHFLDMWLRKNSVDIPNTGVRNTVIQLAETKVLVGNWLGSCWLMISFRCM